MIQFLPKKLKDDLSRRTKGGLASRLLLGHGLELCNPEILKYGYAIPMYIIYIYDMYSYIMY